MWITSLAGQEVECGVPTFRVVLRERWSRAQSVPLNRVATPFHSLIAPNRPLAMTKSVAAPEARELAPPTAMPQSDVDAQPRAFQRPGFTEKVTWVQDSLVDVNSGLCPKRYSP